ncbi:hypothetical protein [Prosthecobacter dejongeii]|uniref:Uncharacterized protein n=1 Tax=Prosthecobacter dejongeii TaxID=48465 RepID=A0A7W7YJF3_9BACT|nr:hypothetical protein [Prosthecobacter dejongeii]MBB5037345.1 hypothetical protein [Prosthecobacter dejongeii]
MFASRIGRITRKAGRVEFVIHNRWPYAAIPAFLVLYLIWLGAGVFMLGGILGFVSPETMTPVTRTFLCFWTLGWAVLGALSCKDGYRKAFVRVEGVADKDGLRLVRRSILGRKTWTYAWSQIDGVTEVVIDGKFYRHVALYVEGKHVDLDSHLEPKTAQALVNALEDVREEASS